ncbi:MAG TPA: thiamine-phosphate kinase [Blastocatellia bacterium]|nr:thiamine-phosphate kinase [Blastocatellia bacterium]
MPRESEIISRIKQRARSSDQVLVGIGDDAAVIKVSAGRDVLACCDLMVEGVHFQLDRTPPRLLGRKALAINLSDIAAMGGVPRFAMVSIALTHQCSSQFIDEVFEGILGIADEQGVSLIGGDTSSSRDSLFIDVSVIGECAAGKAVTRSGAKPGDIIYVSGSLGASALGLRLLQDGVRIESTAADDLRRQALMKHLSPEPQSRLGRAIGEATLATAMIDISDGLSTDSSHILEESRCGAIIHAGAVPIAESVRDLTSGSNEFGALNLALNSGEEYELLFTATPEWAAQIEELSRDLSVAISAIGEIVEGEGLRLERAGALEKIAPSGYEHLI